MRRTPRHPENVAAADDRASSIFGENDPERYTHVRDWLKEVSTIREHVAALVIAGGVNEGDDWVEYVAEFLNKTAGVVRDEIHRLDERLIEQGIDTSVPDPMPYDPKNRSDLASAVVSMNVGYNRAAYLLGLAVGMQLGPDALKGRAR